MTTMKEAIVDKDISVSIIDSPIPKPGPGEVLIKVVVSGTNPKDWKVPAWTSQSANTGDDIAGIVEAVDEGIYSLHKGDRVAALHQPLTPSGSFAEYAIAPQSTTFPFPDSISFEEGATIPLAAYTAVVAIFYQLGFPAPWDKIAKNTETNNKDTQERRPLVVYGASTAIGAFGIKLAHAAGVHPIIAVGSKNSEFIRPFLDSTKGDCIVDYTAHKTNEELIDAIKNALENAGSVGGRTFDAFDCVSDEKTIKLLTKLMAGEPSASGRRPRVTVILPVEDKNSESSVEVVRTEVGLVHSQTGQGEFASADGGKLFGLVWSQAFSRGLAEGWLTAHPYEVQKGGLAGLGSGLKGLRDGTVRAKKILVRPGETEGAKA